MLGKEKLPLTLGIKAAKNEHLLLTDADCKPKSNQWIKKMARGFKEKEIILGYGPYIKTNGLLNSIIRFDTAWIGINYFSLRFKWSCIYGCRQKSGLHKKCLSSCRWL